MGAIEEGKIETVKLILSFKYVPTDPAFFEKSKQCKDLNGNNALHLAHKYVFRDIAKILEEHQIGVLGKRNHRGLAPKQMNHKRLQEIEGEIDTEPDYVFVVKKQRADFLIT